MIKKFSLCIIMLLLLITVTSAHPGRTDGRGGHYDSETGEYHYHHGYEAHQHTDLDDDGIPDCPYDFDDKTGESSGSKSGFASGKQEYHSEIITVETEKTHQPTQINRNSSIAAKENEKRKIPDGVLWFLVFVVGPYAALFLYVSICVFIENRRNRIKILRESMFELSRIYETEINKRNWRSYHKHHQKILAHEISDQLRNINGRALNIKLSYNPKNVPDIDSIAPIPNGCFIGADALPHSRPDDDYTVFITKSGVYHSRKCAYAKYGHSVNITKVVSSRPCFKCNPKPDLRWYVKRVESEKQLNALQEVLAYTGNTLSPQLPGQPERETLMVQKPLETQSLYIQHSSESEVIFSFTNEENRTVENLHIPSEKELHDAEERKKFRTSFLIQLCVIAVLCLLLCLRSCVE